MVVLLLWLAQIALLAWLSIRGREAQTKAAFASALSKFLHTLRTSPALLVWGGGSVLLFLVAFTGLADGAAPLALMSAGVQLVIFLALLASKAIGPLGGGHDMTFGSARFATLDHARANDLIGREGLRLGTMGQAATRSAPAQSHPVHYKGERHLLTVAPTRAGKGVSVIIPNLLTYPGSTIVIDPKGENARITYDARAKLGRAFALDPWAITGKVGARFNPLDLLTADSPTLIEDAMLIADALVMEDGKGENRFWTDEARALIMGFLLHVSTSPSEAGRRHLGRVRDILTSTIDTIMDIGSDMADSNNPVVVSSAARIVSKDEKLLANVLSTAQQNTHFLESPALRAHLEASDFSFRDLKGDTPHSVYIVLPVERLSTYSRWLRMIIALGISEIARTQTTPRRPVLFLLDEFAQLGRLKIIEDAYGLMAGMGIQLHAITQDLSQLERLYDKGWQTFVGNAGVIQFFGTRDLQTAEYASKMLGTTTRMMRSTSSSTAGQNSSSSINFAPTQRPLVFPDELMRMGPKAQIIFIENADPILGTKIRWFEDAELLALSKGQTSIAHAIDYTAAFNVTADQTSRPT